MQRLPLATDKRYYVSLGDAQSRNTDNFLGAASRFYNRLAITDSSLKMVPLATDGATAATVRYVQIPRLREMNTVPAVITLTLGTSDLARLAFGDKDAVCRDLREHGSEVLLLLRGLAPLATILISTLYDPMDGMNTLLTQGILLFNEALQELAQHYSAEVTDIYTVFAGHGASVGDPLTPQTDFVPSGLYLCVGSDLTPVPNEAGAEIFAEALRTTYHYVINSLEHHSLF